MIRDKLSRDKCHQILILVCIQKKFKEHVTRFFGTARRAEAASSYMRLLESFCSSVQTLCGQDIKPKIKALHSDFAPGLEAAREAFFEEVSVTRRGRTVCLVEMLQPFLIVGGVHCPGRVSWFSHLAGASRRL